MVVELLCLVVEAGKSEPVLRRQTEGTQTTWGLAHSD